MTKENKTLGITLRFWTNDLEVANKKKVNSCWDSGMALVEANKSKGISAGSEPFNKFTEIEKAIEKLLRKQNIYMVKGSRTGRLK